MLLSNFSFLVFQNIFTIHIIIYFLSILGEFFSTEFSGTGKPDKTIITITIIGTLKVHIFKYAYC